VNTLTHGILAFGADFFGAVRARVYDDEVRNWVTNIGVENMGKKLVNSKEGPPTFTKPAMTIEKLMTYGFMLVQEQQNVQRVQLADQYMSSAALGDANQDAISQGTFFGKISLHLSKSTYILHHLMSIREKANIILVPATNNL
jgi:hypothetical protein